MGIRMYFASVCIEKNHTGRTGQRNRKYLVGYVLAGECIVQGEQAIHERQIRTKLIRACVLRFQVRIVSYRIFIITDLPVYRIGYIYSTKETAPECTFGIVVRIILPCHSYFGVRSAYFRVSKDLVLYASSSVRINPAETDGRRKNDCRVGIVDT